LRVEEVVDVSICSVMVVAACCSEIAVAMLPPPPIALFVVCPLVADAAVLACYVCISISTSMQIDTVF
jgi:hypothetical protein